MSALKSITADSIIIDSYNTGRHFINFDESRHFHFEKNDSLMSFYQGFTLHTIKINEEDFLIIKKLYDNYQINQIVFKLMQTDPISNVSEIRKRAAEYYLQKENIKLK